MYTFSIEAIATLGGMAYSDEQLVGHDTTSLIGLLGTQDHLRVM